MSLLGHGPEYERRALEMLDMDERPYHERVAEANVQVNPKMVQAQKEGKVDYSTVPWWVMQRVAKAMMEGAEKYGRFNFIDQPIEARTYIAAIARHMFGDPSNGTQGWANGEDIDPDSGEHHLTKVISCCLVALAAIDKDMLIDNRMTTEVKTPPAMREEEWKEDELRPPYEPPLPSRKVSEHDVDAVQAFLDSREPHPMYTPLPVKITPDTKIQDVFEGFTDAGQDFADAMYGVSELTPVQRFRLNVLREGLSEEEQRAYDLLTAGEPESAVAPAPDTSPCARGKHLWRRSLELESPVCERCGVSMLTGALPAK